MTSTIKDVAKMADVSISTVSRVINESKPVSPETRRRVLHAIEVLDYKPNEIARSLVKKKSNIIGVIVNDLGTTYTSQILRGVEEIGRMYGYDIIVASSYDNTELEIKFAKIFSQKQAEGIIVISESLNQKLMFTLEEMKVPHLNINRFYNLEEGEATINQEKATEEITEYVINKGHKKIAYLAMAKDLDRTLEKQKVDAFKNTMKKHNLEREIVYAPSVDEKGAQDIYGKVKALYQSGYTAMICTQDELAIHIANLFYGEGIRVPDDISLAGFGGGPLADIYRPRITTIKIPYYNIGAVSVRKILKAIENNREMEKQEIVLQAKLVEGGSVKDIR